MKIINSPSFFIGKSNENLISFGSGQPDLSPPAEVYKILPSYRDFKYGPVAGLEKLREALCLQYPDSNSNQFIITNGASEALDLTLRVLQKYIKKILIPRPYYYSYPYNVEFAGLKYEFYDLENGKINLQKLLNQLKNVEAILINSPSNPTGAVQDITTLKTIEKYTQDRDIFVISDEVYKDLIYERKNYLIGGPRVITINSFSKTYAMCGFRIGYLYTRDIELVHRVLEMKTHTSMNTNILGQEMALVATKVPESHIKKHVEIWKKRRDIIYNYLCDMGLSLNKPEGAFYVLPKVKDSSKAITELYHQYGIVAYDGKWFGSPNRIRLSYALDEDKIERGMKIFKEFLLKSHRLS